MFDCNFELNADGLWQCQACGWIYKKKTDNPPRRNCRPDTPEQIAERERQHAADVDAGVKLGWSATDAKHWVAALRKWRKAGKPKRTDAEVAAILEICQTCEEYRADEQRCAKCRCCISKKGMAVFNKARLATETCPMGYWR